MSDQFWDFNRLFKDGAPMKSRDHRISFIFRACGTSKGFTRVYVMS
jgi:hypothetical protein